MGMRRNIALAFDDASTIYLYTHWGAEGLEETLREALLRGKDRWRDPSYLARIIFFEMIQDEVLRTTGYGIAPYPIDEEYPTIKVDLKHQMVGDRTFEEFVTSKHCCPID